MNIASEIIISSAIPENAFDIQNLLKDTSKQMYLDGGFSEEDFNLRFKDSISDNAINECAKNIESLSENERYIVALKNDKVIGLCYVEKEDIKNILHAMYILPEFQNQGVGTLLWKNVKDFFDSEKDVVLDVFVSNQNAIKFYKKLGFVDYGKRTSEERFKSSSGVNIIEMKMVLIGHVKP